MKHLPFPPENGPTSRSDLDFDSARAYHSHTAGRTTPTVSGSGPLSLQLLFIAREEGQPRQDHSAIPSLENEGRGVSTVIPIKKLFEAHIIVRDLQRSVAFYRDVLGLQVGIEQPERPAAFFWVGGRGKSNAGDIHDRKLADADDAASSIFSGEVGSPRGPYSSMTLMEIFLSTSLCCRIRHAQNSA